MPFEEFSSTYQASSTATPTSGMTAPATLASMASPGGARCNLGRMFHARLILNPGSDEPVHPGGIAEPDYCLEQGTAA